MYEDEQQLLLERWSALEAELEAVRARLARGAKKRPLPTEPTDLLFCGRGDERYAFSLSCVEEVVPVARLVLMPEAPVYVAGVLDLRGELVPVVDLVARLHGHRREVELDDSIMVARVDGRLVGLLVEGIPELGRVPHDRLREPPPDLPFVPYVWALLENESASCPVLDLVALVRFSYVPEAHPT